MAIHKIIAIIFIGQGLNKAMQAILPVISNSPDKISKKMLHKCILYGRNLFVKAIIK